MGSRYCVALVFIVYSGSEIEVLCMKSAKMHSHTFHTQPCDKLSCLRGHPKEIYINTIQTDSHQDLVLLRSPWNQLVL